MERRDDSSQPLGICHRLFNFMAFGLIARGFKPATLGRPVPIQGSSSMNAAELQLKASPPNHLANKDNQIVAQTAVAVPTKEKGHRVREINLMGVQRKTDVDHPKIQGKVSPIPEASMATNGREEVPKKSLRVKDSAVEPEEEEKREKYQNLPTENSTLDIEVEDTEMKTLTPERPHLLSVVSNINAKSGAFIRRKKEDMTRNYSLEPRKS